MALVKLLQLDTLTLTVDGGINQVLDGLGIDGGGAHAANEHIFISDIARRGALRRYIKRADKVTVRCSANGLLSQFKAKTSSYLSRAAGTV